MKTSILNYDSYKEILLDYLPVSGSLRGARSRLAHFLGCQLSFVSLVLTTEKNHFNLEQGEKITQFLGLSNLEKDYFLLMLSRDRAGTKDLSDYYQAKMNIILKEKDKIKNRVNSNAKMNTKDQSLYYSDWFYTAIHMILRCNPEISAAELSKKLNLPLNKINDCLLFLEKCGVVKNVSGKLIVQDIRIHIPEGATWLNAHHKNWRNRSIFALDNPNRNDSHYTMITSISEEKAIEIKQKILQLIQDLEPIIKSADDEVVYNFNIDFFKIFN